MLKDYIGDILRLLLGIIILVVSLFFYKTPFLLFSYAILGYPLIIKLIKDFLHNHHISEVLIIIIVVIGSLYLKNDYEGIIIIIVYQLFNYFKKMMLYLANREVSRITNLKCSSANIKLDDNIISINIERIRVNDIIVVNKNEFIPLDGIIVKGTSKIDNSLIKNRKVVEELTVNDSVLSGSINTSSPLEIRVTKTIDESYITTLLKMLPSKDNSKISFERLINHFYRYNLIITILLFLLIIILSIFSNTIIFSEWLDRLLVLLLLTNTWSLFLIIPFAYAYISNLEIKKGIYIKKRKALNKLSNIKTIVLDMDGILTKNEYHIVKVIPYQISEKELLRYGATTTYYASDSIAASFKEKYQTSIKEQDITNYRKKQEYHYEALIKNEEVIVGNKQVFTNKNIKFPDVDMLGICLLVAVNNEYVGTIVLEDELKDEAFNLKSQLESYGIQKIIVFTDVNKRLADRISNKLKIETVYPSLSLNDKRNHMLQLQKNNNLAYIGDDLSLLTLADVSIAFNKQDHELIDNSDIVINNDDLNSLSKVLSIARKVKEIIFTNIILVLSIKIISFILALIGLLSLTIVIIIELIVLIIVIMNTVRVNITKKEVS